MVNRIIQRRVLSTQPLLAIGYFLVVAAWSIGIAFHGAPDESTHFFLVEYLNRFHTLPNIDEPTRAFTGTISGHTWLPGDFWYSGLPFPHVLGALLTSKIGELFLAQENWYLGVRAFNWIMGSIFICAVYRISRGLDLPNPIALLIALITGLIPQVTFIFSYFNSDAYGLACIALTLSALVNFTSNPSRATALSLGFTTGMLILAKIYFLPAIVFVITTLIINQFFSKKHPPRYYAIMIGTLILVAAPLLAITYAKYGEISGISGQLDFVAKHKFDSTIKFGTCYLACQDGIFNWSTIIPWLTLSLKSYFSVTGWMNIYIADEHYMIAAIVFCGVIITTTICAIDTITKRNKEEILRFVLPTILALGLFPSIIIMSIIASQNSIPQPQGRYLFVTIPFLALLMALTASKFSDRVKND